ncbi:D-alanyl-D-alanine carboxypeptidase [Kaistia defluvii]|uniref:D-alanyl-D-alanine carboxypeptidase family protein n=1 Tax=Kaistia defluvii TaxID=410841 RepID=UPI00225744C6|nr:D-alanyl-D-alanine carboxypeptidase family protein [Kaistia defluvii]MCX5518488.1 D-alanyl-D-alanine carboxypeptidase [Kaistia defluvii]
MHFVTRSIARFLSLILLVGLGVNAASAVETPYIVADIDSGKVLAARNAHQDWYPASVTKLMSAYVVFKAIRDRRISLASQIVVSRHALNEQPSKMGFKVGTVIDLDNALKMMLVHSANDIAMAIAETVGGSESGFVAMMNAEAARLGMTNTHFINPNGLPGEGQFTSARDLALLARALWIEFPERRQLYGITAIRSGKRVLKSANSLLERYPGSSGMKTGFICASGFNVVATASRDGHTLVAVVLGASTAKERAELTARLMNQSFGSLALTGNRPTLASFRGASPVEGAINMRDDICNRKDRGEHEAENAAAPNLPSALMPRVKLMEPVVVSTIGVRNPDGSIKPAAVAEAEDEAAAIAAAAAKQEKKQKGKAAKAKAGKKAADKKTVAKPVAKPARKSDDKPVKAKASTKPKIELGVPFDSTDVAPLPDSALAISQ